MTALLAPVAGAAEARDLLERYSYAARQVPGRVRRPAGAARPPWRSSASRPSKLERGLLHVALGGESVDVNELDRGRAHQRDREAHAPGAEEGLLPRRAQRARDRRRRGRRGRTASQRAAEALRNENYQVETLLLAAQGRRARGRGRGDRRRADAAASTSRSIAALERYLERGGALLVLLDPRAQTDLGVKLARWGVEVGDDVIVDRVQGCSAAPTTPFAAEYGDPITRELARRRPCSTSRAACCPPRAPRRAISPIVRTGEQSWAERDIDRLLHEGRRPSTTTDGPEGPGVRRRRGHARARGAAAAAGRGRGAARAEDRAPRGASATPTSRQPADPRVPQPRPVRELRELAARRRRGDLGAARASARASRLQLTQRAVPADPLPRRCSCCPRRSRVLGVIAWWQRRRAPAR